MDLHFRIENVYSEHIELTSEILLDIYVSILSLKFEHFFVTVCNVHATLWTNLNMEFYNCVYFQFGLQLYN